MLRRLLGEQNPFPLVRVPYERIESPWGMGVLLHEIGHNLQADLTVWQETQQAVQRRVWQVSRDAWVTRIWARWHKEIFADLVAILLGGPASARSMKDFLAYPASRVLSFRPLSVHPTPYLRMFIQAEMLRRMGFRQAAGRIRAELERALLGARAARPDTAAARRDRAAHHPSRRRRNGVSAAARLAQRALVDVVPFSQADERAIQQAAAADCPRGAAGGSAAALRGQRESLRVRGAHGGAGSHCPHGAD